MQRRDFCKMIAASAGATAISSAGRVAEALQSSSANGFDGILQDYAEFCATPSNQRVFHALQNAEIVKEKLDEQTWQPTAWGEPPNLPGGSWDGVPSVSPIAGLNGDGPYKPTWDSLLQYEAPEWYRDAKFGIWAHWSPQCVPEAGDWYARNMYMEGSDQFKYQLAHYGHPSAFGYKDLCSQWTLLNWEPDELIQRYKRAGARLFIALANHHDGFDAWNSRHHPWNAQNIGPHRDVVGIWAEAARKQGLRFGVTVHQARNWWWFQTSHGADKAGPLAGTPYDGNLTAADGKGQWWQGFDPQQLYGPKHPVDALPEISYVKNFYDRTRDLIDQHNPDLLYFDNALLPLGWAGMNIGSYFYNNSLRRNGGRMEAVMNVKQVPAHLAKSVVADYERGLTNQIMPYAWQSETCIGDWHYRRELFERPGEFGGYLHPRDIIHWLADTVSKNGTFILNIPGKPDGAIDPKEIAVLDEIANWMQVNGEAIYATRPWKIYGEGPHSVKSGPFQGNSVNTLGPQDIRFTRNKAGTTVYAIVLGLPEKETIIQALGTSSQQSPGRVANVELLGYGEKVEFRQSSSALRVQLPAQKPSEYAIALKIALS
jgi:alpha-L-fucosidase